MHLAFPNYFCLSFLIKILYASSPCVLHTPCAQNNRRYKTGIVQRVARSETNCADFIQKNENNVATPQTPIRHWHSLHWYSSRQAFASLSKKSRNQYV